MRDFWIYAAGFGLGLILRPSIQLLWQIACKIWRNAKAATKQEPK